MPGPRRFGTTMVWLTARTLRKFWANPGGGGGWGRAPSATRALSSSSGDGGGGSPSTSTVVKLAAARIHRGTKLPTQGEGQPTPETHPHLMSSGELTPGFSADEYRRRRRALADHLPANSVAVLAAAPPAFLPSTIIPYPGYRQEADFAYLTGVLQPGVVMMLERPPDGKHVYTLFVPPRSARDEIWNGQRIGTDAAIRFFGADATHELSDMDDVIARAARRASAVFADEGRQGGALSTAAFKATGKLHGCGPPRTLRPIIQALRWQKSPAEIQALRESVDADIQGFHSAIQASVPGALEYMVCANHEHRCKAAGASRLAYPSVVGSGPGALVVHYAAMDRVLEPGELLLMDAGCERRGYASDVTRTWPVGPGGFTQAQADVYEAVLEAHAKCLNAVALGVSVHDLHMLSVKVLSESLANLGVRGGKSQCMRYYPHSVGHWLGMDTHDTPTVPTTTPIQPGCVLTIEPGLYLPSDDPAVPKSLRGIGVRIEDDVAMMPETGEVEVLSRGLPTSVVGIESLVQELQAGNRHISRENRTVK